MTWSILNFSKHKGKTLPQVLFSDPDWFFWAVEEGVFQKRAALRKEAADLDSKARRIKIPSDMKAEYAVDPDTNKFVGMELVPASQPRHEGSTSTSRLSVINLSIPREIASYDKLGFNIMMRSIKFHLFRNERTPMTKKRCEDFFDDPLNFA